MHESEFQRGIEWYMWNKGGDEPAAKIRPSQAQFTAIRELLRCRVFYDDLGLLHPHDMRTSRANRWTDWIDQNGVPHRTEVHGPATPTNWKENWAVFECSIIMANATRPPRIEAYGQMFLEHVEQYPESYALGYQCDDRHRHKNVGEILRKETTIYDRRVKCGWIPGSTEEASFLDPSSP